MKRRFFVGVLGGLAIGYGLPADADPTRVNASAIEALLSGNTIVGSWSSAPYRQFFKSDGTTIYVPDVGRPDEGRWRVNAETNNYESWWRSTGWTPYAMVRTEDGAYAWVNGDSLEPFDVLEGRQVE
ncbi:hypothetical protein [uncultured Roseovarius sp.]|uniref:hypothetical protein n=1 Tax=uncultured Roseovarius sp. TaxID=293344 RepID=UPI0026397930|nr:hypothetical protein [uncultured Roseovarius sp.]